MGIKENIKNEDNIGENELLVASFGTSFNSNRKLTIAAVENELEKAFPDFSLRRCFTSGMIIKHIYERDNLLIDDIDAAFKRAVNNGVKNIIVQPTHLMDGIEYHKLLDKLSKYEDSFEKVSVGEPLLMEDDDFKKVMDAVVDDLSEYVDEDTAVCLMGHGTEAESNSVYFKLQKLFINNGYNNFFIGTVEAEPTVEDLLESVKLQGFKRVVLAPLMLVAGDHANNDMAGDEEDSWKSIFEAAGYEVECILNGIGSVPAIQQIYVEHALKAKKNLR